MPVTSHMVLQCHEWLSALKNRLTLEWLKTLSWAYLSSLENLLAWFTSYQKDTINLGLQMDISKEFLRNTLMNTEHAWTFKQVSSIGTSVPSVTTKSIPLLYVKICNLKYIYVVYTQVLFYSLSRMSTWLSTFQETSDGIRLIYLNSTATIWHTHLYGESTFLPSLKQVHVYLIWASQPKKTEVWMCRVFNNEFWTSK